MYLYYTCVQEVQKKHPDYSFHTSFVTQFFTEVADLSQEFVKSAFHTAEPNLQVDIRPSPSPMKHPWDWYIGPTWMVHFFNGKCG